MSALSVLAVAAHPDDIEIMMAGTLLLLKDRKCELHHFTVANGCCGTIKYPKDDIVKIREKEGRSAARVLGAVFYRSLTDDFTVLYTESLLRKVAAVVRKSRPDIVLLPSLQDPMEDRVNAARLGVTAAFVLGMPNFETDPPVPPLDMDTVLYHTLPHGLCNSLGQRIEPGLFVDIGPVLDAKTDILGLHKTQKDHFDKSQGKDSYLFAMQDEGRQVGMRSGVFTHAEGWQRHSRLGFSSKDTDPLSEILGPDRVKSA